MHPGKLLPFVITGAVLVIGGSYMWNLSYQTDIANNRLEEMAAKLVEINSAGFDATFDLQMSAEAAVDSSSPAQSSQIKVKVSGAQDVKDVNNPKAMMTIEGSLESSVDSESVGDGMAKLEMRVIGKVIYVKLIAVPDIAFFNLKPLVGTWIRIDPAEIMQQFGLNPDDLEVAGKKDEISPEQAERLRRLWQDADVLKVVSVKSGEVIDGVETYHYVFEVQKPQLIAYVKKVATELVEDVPAEDMATMEKNINDADLPQGELWMGKSDLYLRRLRVEHQLEASDVRPTTASLVFEFSLKNINKPVSVIAPADAKSIEEVMKEMFAAMSESVAVDDARGSTYYGPSLPNSPLYNPAEQFAQARDTQRNANVNSILNAIGQNMADNRGVFTCSAGPLPSTVKLISSFEYDIAPCIVPDYLYTMVTDPSSQSYWKDFEQYESGYSVYADPRTGVVTVAAPFAETEDISVSR